MRKSQRKQASGKSGRLNEKYGGEKW